MIRQMPPPFARPNIEQLYRTPESTTTTVKFTRRRASLGPAKDYLSKVMPDNVLHHIFSYMNKRDLSSLMRTCRRFQAIGTDSVFWKFLNLANKTLTEQALHSIIDRQTKILRLYSATIESLPFIQLEYNLYPAALTHLDLGLVEFWDAKVLRNLLKRCENLIGLSLERCELIDDEICKEIAKNTNLQYLSLGLTSGLSPKGLSLILKKCRSLVELNIGWANLTDETVEAISTLFPASLKRLNFSGSSLP